MDAATQSLLLQQLERTLDACVMRLNRRSKSYPHCTEHEVAPMREVRGLANTIRDSVQRLRTAHAQAAQKLQSEVTASEGNLEKLDAFTAELHDANREVEAMLGDTGSNFQPKVDSDREPPKTDRNGVAVNPDAAQHKAEVDHNGVKVNKG